MTEGGIASWKKKDGEKFEAGDVLLEIVRCSSSLGVEKVADGLLVPLLRLCCHFVIACSAMIIDHSLLSVRHACRKPTRRQWTSRPRTTA